MPVHPFLNAFTTGEITDQLIARTTWEKYQNAAACLKNFVVRPYGGAARRAGTIYLGEVKDSSQRIMLRRFEFNITQAYILEMGQGYIRFWANRARVVSAGVPVEVATPYLTSELRELRFEQSADVLYITHHHHPPMKLQRTSATAFQLDPINFQPVPTFEQEVFPVADLTLTALSGTGQFAGTSAPVFLAGDVGRQIRSAAGRAVITAFGTATSVGINIIDAFDTTGPIPSGDWRMDGSPNAGTLLISSNGPVNSSASFTSSLDAFRPEDVGAYLYVAGGMAQIYEVASPTVANAMILRELTGTPPITAAIGSWTLERPVWSADLGYPGVVALHDQRLWFAGSDTFPDRVWASNVADYENFARGVEDDDALDYQLALSGVNLVRWMKGLPDGLGVGTLASEAKLDGGGGSGGNPMTPTSVRARELTFYGCDYTVDAIHTTNLVLFVQRGAQRIRELTPNPESVNAEYVAPDLTILAEQLTRTSIVELDRAASPDSIVFAITGGGELLTCAYERPENVIGWSHHETQGLYESVAVIPNNCGSGDEVWVEVNRQVQIGDYWATGYWATRYWAPSYWALDSVIDHRTIEVFDGGLNTDAGLVYAGVAAQTFTGLGHLEGQTVKAIDQDGVVYDLVVVSGAVTLPPPATATELEVGLHYTSTLKSLRPELQGPAGTAQARRKRWQTVTLRVYCTRGRLQLGETGSDMAVLEYPEGTPGRAETVTDTTESYTGDMGRMANFGWSREGQLTIQTLDPKPCTILALTGQLEMDDA